MSDLLKYLLGELGLALIVVVSFTAGYGLDCYITSHKEIATKFVTVTLSFACITFYLFSGLALFLFVCGWFVGLFGVLSK